MKYKPFDLEAALSGEPVVLRNGRKAYIKYKLDNVTDVRDALNGYFMGIDGYNHAMSWTIEGKANYGTDDNNDDVMGMWQELRPRVQLDLPCPLKEPQEGMWYFINSEVYKSSYIEGGEKFDIARLKSGGYFVTKEDAQEWLEALKGARR